MAILFWYIQAHLATNKIIPESTKMLSENILLALDNCCKLTVHCITWCFGMAKWL